MNRATTQLHKQVQYQTKCCSNGRICATYVTDSRDVSFARQLCRSIHSAHCCTMMLSVCVCDQDPTAAGVRMMHGIRRSSLHNDPWAP
eukprot:1360967-Amphidinium_carterae.1